MRSILQVQFQPCKYKPSIVTELCYPSAVEELSVGCVVDVLHFIRVYVQNIVGADGKAQCATDLVPKSKIGDDLAVVGLEEKRVIGGLIH